MCLYNHCRLPDPILFCISFIRRCRTLILLGDFWWNTAFATVESLYPPSFIMSRGWNRSTLRLYWHRQRKFSSQAHWLVARLTQWFGPFSQTLFCKWNAHTNPNGRHSLGRQSPGCTLDYFARFRVTILVWLSLTPIPAGRKCTFLIPLLPVLVQKTRGKHFIESVPNGDSGSHFFPKTMNDRPRTMESSSADSPSESTFQYNCWVICPYFESYYGICPGECMPWTCQQSR